MVKVSIIIPVYNVEKYLARCLDSCINQTFSDIEMVCVNDGSTDSSLNILEQYAKLDSRIKIIQQENGGLSSARNTGVENAKGEYILFLDSDDFISNIAIELLVANIERNGSDVVLFDYLKFYKNHKKDVRVIINHINEYKDKCFNLSDLKSLKDCRKVIYQLLTFYVSAWCKFYRASFLKENGISFYEGVLYEDVPYMAEIFVKSRKFSYEPEMLLAYSCYRDNQIMSKNGEEYFDLFKVYARTFEYIENSDYAKFLKKYYSMAFIMDSLSKLDTIREDLKESFFNTVKSINVDYKSIKLDKEITDFEKMNLNCFELLISAKSYQEFLTLQGKANQNVKS